MRASILKVVIATTPLFLALSVTTTQAIERLGRGMITRTTREGHVYVGWRLLASDPPGRGFLVGRRATLREPSRPLNVEPITDRCGFVDTTAEGKSWLYDVQHMGSHAMEAASLVGHDPNTAGEDYLAIKLQGDYGANKVAIAFTGTGAMNSGMALETLNLAAAWSLPLVIVCIDNGWAITTASEAVTGGKLIDRARAFGLRADSVDGRDVRTVHKVAGKLIDSARRGKGPAFLLATCPRLDGHFLGDPLLRMARQPVAEGKSTFAKVIASATSRGGGGLKDRAGGMKRMMSVMARARRSPSRERRGDPMLAARKSMKKQEAERDRIDAEVAAEIEAAVKQALDGVGEADRA